MVERLGLQILWRLCELGELQDSPDDHRDVISAFLALPRYSIEGNHPEFAMRVTVGDLVLTPLYAGVISDFRTSTYGNRACLVQPITEEHSLTEDGDWWPSVTLRPWLSVDVVMQKAQAICPEIPENLSNEQRVELAVNVAQAILRKRAAR
jgi:hypothetical protein